MKALTKYRSLTSAINDDLKEPRREHIRELWDSLLDLAIEDLLERVAQKSTPITELRHVVDEVRLILGACRGKRALWGSVIEVALVLLKSDATIGDLRARLRYAESTIYRALARLQAAGFAEPIRGETTARVWTVNREKCPILSRASR